MKSINFIKPLPPKKQRLIALWLYSSLFLIIAFLAGATYLQFFRLRQAQQLAEDLGTLQQKSAAFEDYVTKKNVLTKNKLLLEEQLSTLRSFHNQIESMHGLLSALATLTPPTIRLLSLKGKPNETLTIEGFAVNAQAVTQFLQNLSQTEIVQNLKLIHLLPDEEKSPDGKAVLRFKTEGSWKLNTTINLEE